MMKLKSADMYRDGGSLGANFEQDDGTTFCVFLEISPRFWTEGESIHGRLFACSCQEAKDSIPIPKGSDNEKMIVKRLADWISVNISSSDQKRLHSIVTTFQLDQGDYAAYYVLKLVHAIEDREPEPPAGGDGKPAPQP